MNLASPGSRPSSSKHRLSPPPQSSGGTLAGLLTHIPPLEGQSNQSLILELRISISHNKCLGIRPDKEGGGWGGREGEREGEVGIEGRCSL